MSRYRAENGEFDRSRAVSDLIGFSLMFSIIIAGVGLISVTGLNQLVELSENEELNAAERGMNNAAATLDEMNRQGDLNRSFTLAFTNSNIYFNDSSEIEVEHDSDSWHAQGALEQEFDRDPKAIRMVYEGGAVFRSDGAAARYAPAITCDDESDRAVVSLVNLSLAQGDLNRAAGADRGFLLDELSIPGDAPVSSFDNEIRFNAEVTDVESDVIDDASDIEIIVDEAAQPDEWKNELEDEWGDDLECNLDDGQAIIRVVHIELDIDTPQIIG